MAPGPYPLWSAMPFATLLLVLAIVPAAVPLWWRRYLAVVCGGAALSMGALLVLLGHPLAVIQAIAGYASFIALIAGLTLAVSGIVLEVEGQASTKLNLAVLMGGALLANLIGTTGAALLLIRPFLRLNAGRVGPAHVVVFIVLVANIGGALTPIGDPPLLLGFLQGVGFWRYLTLDGPAWLIALAALAAIFCWIDTRTRQPGLTLAPVRMHLRGLPALGWLAIVVGATALDPQALPWLPALSVSLDGHVERISVVRELLQLGAGWAAWRTAHPSLRAANQAMKHPLREVALVFLAIFTAVPPALALMHDAASPATGLTGTHMAAAAVPNGGTLFAIVGLLSAVLDNAPTYLSGLAYVQGATGLDAVALARSHDPATIRMLAGCTLGAVFWGGLTYLGNGPNLLIAAIAAQERDNAGHPLVVVPGFAAYTLRYAAPILLPILALVWLACLH